MSKAGIIVALVVLTAIIGGGIYYTSQDEKKDDAMEQKSGEVMEKDNGVAMEGEVMEKEDGEAMEGEVMEKEDGEAMEGEAMEKKDGEAMEGEVMEEKQASSAGTYEAYSASKVSSAPANATTVVFFHASWCPSCRSLDANINASASTIPAGYTILKADYDAETELRKKYGVTTQHTLVQIDSEGNLIKKWTGSPTLASVLAQIS